MSLSDYIGVVLAVTIGTVCITKRRVIAVRALEQHRRVFGVQYDRRSFEVGFAAAGGLFILWAIFVIAGTWLWGGR